MNALDELLLDAQACLIDPEDDATAPLTLSTAEAAREAAAYRRRRYGIPQRITTRRNVQATAQLVLGTAYIVQAAAVGWVLQPNGVRRHVGKFPEPVGGDAIDS